MQLNKFNDYVFKVFIYCYIFQENRNTIIEIALYFNISENLLIKVVHFMAKQNWIITTRGKGGGIELNKESLKLSLGVIIRILEINQKIIECVNSPCILCYQCNFNKFLGDALEKFYIDLDQYTLHDLFMKNYKVD